MATIEDRIKKFYSGYAVSTTLPTPVIEKPAPTLITTKNAIRKIKESGKYISRPTLLKYAKKGILNKHAINARDTRWEEDEIEELIRRL